MKVRTTFDLEAEARAEKLQALQDQAPDDAWWLLVRL